MARIRELTYGERSLRTRAAVTAAALAGGLFLALAGVAGASDYVVNTTAEGGDASIVAPECDSDSTAPGAQCTLRAAIEQANANPGKDGIAIPAGTYNLGSALVVTDSVQIGGAGARATSIVGSGANRVLDLGGSGNSQIADLAISGGRVTNGDGAGIRITHNGPVTLSRVWIHDNHVEATEDGHLGGGLANLSSYQATVEHSTISDNSIVVTGSGPFEAYGGGLATVYNAGLTVLWSTVTGNSAAGWPSAGSPGGQRGMGGGIAAGDYTFVYHSTLASNTADGDGNAVGGNIYGLGHTTVSYSIIAYGDAVSYENCALTQSYNGANVVTDDSCGGSDDDIIGNPRLGPLANNGGPTDTRAPAAEGVAFDAIPACTSEPDQRGLARPVGAGCDTGAVELQADVQLAATSPAAAVVGGQLTYTFTLHNNGPDRTGPLTIDVAAPAGFKASSLELGSLACPTSPLRCTLSQLYAGETRTILLKGSPGAAGNATASATANLAQPLDTALANNHASATASVTAAANPPAPDAGRPVLSALTVSHDVFRVAPRPAALPPRGTAFGFNLSEPARVTIAIARRTAGRRVHGSCRAKTSRNRVGKPSIRYALVGRLQATGNAGINQVAFSGWIRHGRKWVALAPGRYRASLVAVDRQGQRSKTRRLSLRIVR